VETAYFTGSCPPNDTGTVYVLRGHRLYDPFHSRRGFRKTSTGWRWLTV